eukprot:CAMPEP_0171219748 /NCGR_PEP_ID=MMETSP0790-20130122/33879_1 /TAXON_ID=2925 /ORGANISM="Alexandrium catenella, Strain OF101" /LENGTH=294 /DNA_ID=CAMNT_0011685615 /DNA_START=77 /DNA_END=958 /DNA_ORIENTATION=-
MAARGRSAPLAFVLLLASAAETLAAGGPVVLTGATGKTDLAASGPVVLTGATGRTGVLLYKQLLSKNVSTRALVRSAAKAKKVLGCQRCDESEGIFVGDVTKPETLIAPMRGAGSLMMATSAVATCDPFPKCHFPPGGEPVNVDWIGAKATLEAFALATQGRGLGRVVLISTMGTTDPQGQSVFHDISFYKLNFEAELMASGLPFAIVKPCNLVNAAGWSQELLVGHDDDLKVPPQIVPRADVARICVEMLQQPALADGLRFDLCSKVGTPTPDADLPTVLRAARFPWDRRPAE